MSVAAAQRFKKAHPCPICGGADGMPRGKARRCHGFASDDGAWAHCSREEHSGALPVEESGTYAHRMRGPCHCGTEHSADASAWDNIEAAYDYRDERGTLLYQVVRLCPKDFRQRKPDGVGGWDWKTSGIRRVPYQLPSLLASPKDATVYIVEGEKDVDNLRRLGVIATCNPMGAEKWNAVADCARTALAGRHVVIIQDADEPGRRHAVQVAASLSGVTATVQTIELPQKDASDWIDAGGTLVQLEAMTEPRGDEFTADPKASAPRWHRCPDLVDMILSRAAEPMVTLRLGADDLVTVRAGGIVVVMGPTGAGKTSLIAGMLIRHDGVVVVLSRELPADELAARAIGIQCDAGWIDVLTGKVSRADMERALNLPRMVVLDRRDATLARLVEAIVAMKAEHPGVPVLIAVDYAQIIESGEKEIRAKVADVIAQIDDIAREHRAVVLLISQMSRAASRSARNGEAVGADSTDGGAESAAIERAASVTLSIGASGPDREDGTRAVDLSIGKSRMGGGDRVLPMSYCGRSGLWRVAGDSRPAAEVKAEREGQRDTVNLESATLAMIGYASKAKAPFTREELISKVGKGRPTGKAAIEKLLESGELVEVAKRKPRASAWMLWTRDKAEAAHLGVVS